MDTEDVLLRSGFRSSIAEHPYHKISSLQLTQFFYNILELDISPSLGLDIGQHIRLADKSALGHAQLSAQTMRHVMALGQKYMPMLMPLVRWDMKINQKTIQLHYSTSIPNDFSLSQDSDGLQTLERFLIEIILSMHINQACLVSEELCPRLLEVPYSKTEKQPHYSSMYQGDIAYGHDAYRLSFPMDIFDQTLPNYDQHMVDLIEQHCIKMRESLNQEMNTLDEVEYHLNARLGHFPGLEQIAAKMDISPRALRRRLQQSGSSYQQLLQHSKHQLALDLLGNSELSITQISTLCGFSETRNFSSSFKRWQSCSPQTYRHQHKT
ncbi:helix-turn-helix transcriptional regulator [Pseudoteredinibacter isoporae]|uniref:helix-turn-helix transcriptional regulator n=1 Tax=Pseudoteredinibacter isoporae TaxID=570281 RepID=UPI003341390F